MILDLIFGFLTIAAGIGIVIGIVLVLTRKL